MKNYLSINDKIDIIYDFIYNNNNNKCLLNSKININNTNLDDIKVSIKNEEYYKVIKEDILNSKFKYIYSNDECIILKRYSNNYSIISRILFYNNENEINNIKSKINNDNYLNYIFSIFVLTNETSHILLPIINFDIYFSELYNIIPSDIINKFNTKYNNNTVCCIQLRESFFDIYNLYEYIKLQDKCVFIKSLLFQLIYTLAIINREYPGFKHNNIIFNNIYVYLNKINDNKYKGFKNDYFQLNDIKFNIKLTNFENSTFKNKIITNDLNLLFNELKKYDFCDSETKNFINKKYNNYIDMLYDNYFDEYKYINNNTNTNCIKCNNYKGLYKCELNSDNNLELGNQKNIYIMKRQIKKDNLIEKNKRIYLNLNNKNNIHIVTRIIKNDIKINKIKRTKYKQNGGVNFDNIIIKPMMKTPFRTLLEEEIIQNKKQNKDIDINENIDIEEEEINENIKKEKNENIKKEKHVQISNNDLNPFLKNENIINYPIQQQNNYQQSKYEYKQDNTIDLNPFARNNTKQTYEYKKPNITSKTEPALLMEQRVYNIQDDKKESKPQPPMNIPIYNPEHYPTSTILEYPHLPTYNQKIVNINFGDKFSNFGALDRLYEDYLPGGSKKFTATTFYERMNLIHFVRNSIIKQHDGEYMSLTGNNDVLLSYIKILDINPYLKNTNPFANLPRNFILYTAAYPIKYNTSNKKIEIGNPAMGLNVRIYGLTESELMHQITDKEEFNIWREITYYDYIKNKILQKKKSPNFICPILYKIDPNCKINWTELENLKILNLPSYIREMIKENYYKIDKDDKSLYYKIIDYLNKNNMTDIALYIENIIIQKKLILTRPNGTKYYKTNQGIEKELPPNIINIPLYINNIYASEKLTKKSIILLSEAPTTNFNGWCSINREPFGSVYRMTSTGYHTAKIWYSIIFQLIYIFAILEKENIYMEEITLEDNFYIKDIHINPNTIGSWIYTIGNINYYIPNYGYILMFDSKYIDCKKKNHKYKILSEEIYKNNNNGLNKNDIEKKIHNIFLNIIDSDKFGNYSHMKNVNIVHNEIRDFIIDIKNNFKLHNNIYELFTKTTLFTRFINNKVGTLLTKNEREIVQSTYLYNIQKNINIGEIHVYYNFNDYKWALCINKTNVTNFGINSVNYDIICKDNQDKFIVITNITNGLLWYYPEKILPENIDNMVYDSSYIFETYNIDNDINLIN